MALDLTDYSANSNDLTNNGATVGASTPFAASTISADVESSSSQFLTAADNNSLDISTSITLEAWINPESFGGGNTIIMKGRPSGAIPDRANYALRLEASGKVCFYYNEGTGTAYHLFRSDNIVTSLGTWTHVAVVCTFGTPGSAIIYINGSSVAGSWVFGDGTGPTLTNVDKLAIGALWVDSGSAENFDGILDEIRIWNVIRTPTEISNNYQSELTGSETGLAAYYPFETIIAAAGGVIHPLYLRSLS